MCIGKKAPKVPDAEPIPGPPPPPEQTPMAVKPVDTPSTQRLRKANGKAGLRLPNPVNSAGSGLNLPVG